MCFFSVYLPSRSGCTDVFRESLDYLDSLINLYGIDNDIVVLGDFNADLGLHGGPMATTSSNEQGRILHRYLHDWNFLSVHLHLNQSHDSATYESEAHGSRSTIDHILCPSRFFNSFRSCYVLDEDPSNTSDHLPIHAELSVCLPAPARPSQRTHVAPPPRPNWRKLTSADIKSAYTVPLDRSLSNLAYLHFFTQSLWTNFLMPSNPQALVRW